MQSKFGKFWVAVSFFQTYILKKFFELILFQDLISLSNNKDIQIRSLESIKHSNSSAQNKNMR